MRSRSASPLARHRRRRQTRSQSRSRSRSRSPRAKSQRRRSRSASNNSSDSEASTARHRRRKRAHKSERKPKRHKREKHRSSKRHDPGSSESDADVPHSNNPAAVNSGQDVPASDATDATDFKPIDDVHSFFERVRAQEASKEAVGTVHASGVRAMNPTARVVLEQWECVKRGCGEKNPKRAAACSKCGAMKRLSEWR